MQMMQFTNQLFLKAFLNVFFSQCQMYQQKNNSADQCLSEDFDEDFTSNCLSWKFNDDLIHSTAVEDFEMICGNKSRKSFTQTMYMVGMLIGTT